MSNAPFSNEVMTNGTTNGMLNGGRIRVAVCNDSELVVAGLSAMLRPHAEKVEVADAIVVGDPVRTPVDVAIYDTFGRTADVPGAIRALLDTDGINRVAVYTAAARPAAVEDALAAGAAGVLSKERKADELVDGLRRIHHGEIVVDDDGSDAGERGWSGTELGLTARQTEVVELLLRGKNNAEIAAGLGLDVNTVKTHLRHIYKTLGVSSRSQVLARLLPTDGVLRR